MVPSFAVVCLLAISGSCYGGPVREIPDVLPGQTDNEVSISALEDRIREVLKMNPYKFLGLRDIWFYLIANHKHKDLW